MSGFADRLAALAASTDRRVMALYDSYEAGWITAEKFVELAEQVLDAGQERAAAVADVAAAAVAGSALGGVLLPLGAPRPSLAELAAEVDAQDPVGRPLRTLLDDRAALSIEAQDRVKVTGQAVLKRALREHGVKKWRRRLDGGACELCRKLADAELPMTARMYRHRNCGCTTQPVTSKENDQ